MSVRWGSAPLGTMPAGWARRRRKTPVPTPAGCGLGVMGHRAAGQPACPVCLAGLAGERRHVNPEATRRAAVL